MNVTVCYVSGFITEDKRSDNAGVLPRRHATDAGPATGVTGGSGATSRGSR
jgi:hypothetical protein